MENPELQVLADALAWHRTGHAVTLYTVVRTWGSAPRPVGALLALRGDGVPSGSVSGGCVEDDLIARTLAASPFPHKRPLPKLLTYGESAEDAAHFGLPCGGTLQLVQEPLCDVVWIETVLARTTAHQRVQRSLVLATGKVTLTEPLPSQGFAFDGITLDCVFGPPWRLLLIGAGQLSQTLARMAVMLDFEVLVCDPRAAYIGQFDAAMADVTEVARVPGMPDDAVRTLQPDAHTAIVALTHDPKLDDMALLEALISDAFYVGALGSQRNQVARKARLAEHFGLTQAQLIRLHGPVGLALGGKSPAEIALAVAAELVQVRAALTVTAGTRSACMRD